MPEKPSQPQPQTPLERLEQMHREAMNAKDAGVVASEDTPGKVEAGNDELYLREAGPGWLVDTLWLALDDWRFSTLLVAFFMVLGALLFYFGA